LGAPPQKFKEKRGSKIPPARLRVLGIKAGYPPPPEEEKKKPPPPQLGRPRCPPPLRATP